MHPVLDYVLIGGVWSIAASVLLLARPSLTQGFDLMTLAVLILFINSAHFAASTVRLYSKPSHFQEFPFLTLAFPLITIAVLAACVAFPMITGKHLQALYLTWSPYHYAAQTYGLAVMYAFRSGCKLTPTEKTLLWWGCMLPFMRAFLGAPDSGLGWFVSRETIHQVTYLPQLIQLATDVLLVLTFLAPAVLFAKVFYGRKQFLPLISIVMMVSNGSWWIALDYVNAFVVATIAHGLQYLAIVLVYHVREQLREPTNQRSGIYHATSFYLKCLVLGYGLFYCWPYAFVWTGAGLAESILLVTAIINIHHFIVDAYIWRLRSPDNAKTMVEITPAIPKGLPATSSL